MPKRRSKDVDDTDGGAAVEVVADEGKRSSRRSSKKGKRGSKKGKKSVEPESEETVFDGVPNDNSDGECEVGASDFADGPAEPAGTNTTSSRRRKKKKQKKKRLVYASERDPTHRAHVVKTAHDNPPEPKLVKKYPFHYAHDETLADLKKEVAIRLTRVAKRSHRMNTGHLPTEIVELVNPPTYYFENDFRRKNVPALLKEVVDYWPALDAWTLGGLTFRLKTHPVCVLSVPLTEATRSGGFEAYGPVAAHYAEPMPTCQKFSDFVGTLAAQKAGNSSDISFIRTTGASPRAELGPLADELGASIGRLTENTPLHSVSLTLSGDLDLGFQQHDTDNFLVCISGRHEVTLYSPLDAGFLYVSKYRKAMWARNEDEWSLLEYVPTESTVALPVSAIRPDYERHPLQKRAKKHVVTLHAGEVLFIPYMWWYHTQTSKNREGIAITARYAYFPPPGDFTHKLPRLQEKLRKITGEPFRYDVKRTKPGEEPDMKTIGGELIAEAPDESDTLDSVDVLTNYAVGLRLM